MITIHDNYTEANDYTLTNQVHIRIKGEQAILIAIGDELNWRRKHPLPHGTISMDLVQKSLNEPVIAGEYWVKLLKYVVEASNIRKPFLWGVGFNKIDVVVDIEDAATKQAVAQSIQESKFNIQFTVV